MKTNWKLSLLRSKALCVIQPVRGFVMFPDPPGSIPPGPFLMRIREVARGFCPTEAVTPEVATTPGFYLSQAQSSQVTTPPWLGETFGPIMIVHCFASSVHPRRSYHQ